MIEIVIFILITLISLMLATLSRGVTSLLSVSIVGIGPLNYGAQYEEKQYIMANQLPSLYLSRYSFLLLGAVRRSRVQYLINEELAWTDDDKGVSQTKRIGQTTIT